MAKLTSLLNSPNAFGVSLPSIPASPLAARANKPGRPPEEFVGENKADEEGEVIMRSPCGSMSKEVRKEVSARSSLVDVTERKMSSSRCWSPRGVPLRSRIYNEDYNKPCTHLLEIIERPVTNEQTVILHEPFGWFLSMSTSIIRGIYTHVRRQDDFEHGL